MSNTKAKKVKNNPLISVIITNYNYGRFIAKAASSVLNQTYKNIELIIINDGSTDNSDEIINKIIEKNPTRTIRYVNRANKGVVYTRNEGLRLAKGEYLSFLDADDYFNKDYISKSYEVASEHDVDVVYPNWHFVGEWLGRPDTDFPEFKPELLQLQKLHVTPASLIKKSAVKNHEFEVETVAEDWDFFIGLSLEGKTFKLAKDNFINYRIRKGTRSSRNHPRDDTKNFVEILNKHKKKYGDKVIDPKKLISDRHPNVVRRVFSKRLPRIVIESLKNDGVKETSKKVLRKVAKKSNKAWKIVWYVRNKKYEKVSMSSTIKTSKRTKMAVIVHLYYPEMWKIIKAKLELIDESFDLFISLQEKDKDLKFERVNSKHMLTNVIALPNRGRDVLPFITISRKIYKTKQYKYLLKIHSKKSPHRDDGDEWLNSLLDELIPKNASTLLKTLNKASTGVVGPASHVVSLSRYMGANRDLFGSVLEKVTDRKTIDDILYNQELYPFFGGTMFWCRLDFLKPLLESNLAPADFNTENGQLDRTTAHAIERILGKSLHRITKKKMYVIKRGKVAELPNKAYKSKYKYVE